MRAHHLKFYAVLAVFLLFSEAFAQKFWLTTFEFPGGPKTGICSVGDSTLFVTTTHALLRSTNAGTSWDTALTSTTLFTVFSTSQADILVGGAGRIFRSEDRGMSWDTLVLNHTFPVTQFLQKPDGSLFAITGTLDIQSGFVGAGVFFSGNQGKEWSQRNDGLGIYISCEQIACDNNGRLYLASADEFATGDGGLFISDDNGLHWKHIDILIDGQGAIENKINVETTTALEITPQDSVIFSFLGISRNGGPGVFVRLNLMKAITDVEANTFWLPTQITDVSTWWTDRPLNNIHFAQNGDWYSSTKGSLNTGLTYFSQDNGQHWHGFDHGLGLDIHGRRNIQYFTELSNGTVFMVQLLDERVYWTDTSIVASVQIPKSKHNHLSLFPNPVKQGSPVAIHTDQADRTISIVDALGKEVLRIIPNEAEFEITAPSKPGVYFIRSREQTKALIVY